MAEQPDLVLENGENEIERHSPITQPSSSRTLEQDQSSAQSPSPKSGTGSSIPHGSEDDRPPITEDPATTLDDYDWASLEERFYTKMDECGRAEQKLYDEFSNCVKVRTYVFPCVELDTDISEVFEAWASVTTSHDNDRYYKRYLQSLPLRKSL